MPTPEPPVLVIGEALHDILVGPDGGRQAVPGGSPANVAVGLARLGHPVRLATRVGRDAPGRSLRTHLVGNGVELTEDSVSDTPTSSATVALDPRGAARYDFDIHWDLPSSVVDLAGGGAPAHLHTGSLAALLAPGATRVLAAVETARSRATVSYDPNLRPDLLGPPDRERPRVERLVAAGDVVKASEEDLGWLYPGQDIHEVAARWAGTGPSLVVLTFGGDGAEVLWRHGRQRVPVTPVRVSDTVGAGDAFMSGLLSGLLRAGMLGPGAGETDGPRARTRLRAATSGTELPAELTGALLLASRAAALTCTRPGADPPTRAEAEAALTS